MIKRTCILEGCERPFCAQGYCKVHYETKRKAGEFPPRGTPEDRFWPKVNKSGPVPEMFPKLGPCWIWESTLDYRGYGKFRLDGRMVFAHRVSVEWSIGPIAPGHVIDHMCHTPACVNPGHLRAVTQKQNMENMTGPQRNSTSGVRGVYRDKRNNKWLVLVGHKGRQIHVGRFISKDEAERAAIAKRNELHTHNDADRLATA